MIKKIGCSYRAANLFNFYDFLLMVFNITRLNNTNYPLHSESKGETMQWLDLVRTGKLLETVKLYNPGARNNT